MGFIPHFSLSQPLNNIVDLLLTQQWYMVQLHGTAHCKPSRDTLQSSGTCGWVLCKFNVNVVDSIQLLHHLVFRT